MKHGELRWTTGQDNVVAWRRSHSSFARLQPFQTNQAQPAIWFLQLLSMLRSPLFQVSGPVTFTLRGSCAPAALQQNNRDDASSMHKDFGQRKAAAACMICSGLARTQ